MAKQRRLLGSAIILAVGSIVAKLIGAFYRIPLTNVLGAEGMGMYQLIFPVFALFMVLSSAGIPTALSRIVAEKQVLGEDDKKYLFFTILLMLAFAVVSTIILFSIADVLAMWQGNTKVAVGYRIIAPSIIFVSMIAGFRGWFQGKMYMFPTAISNIIEQIVKLAVGLGLAIYLKPRGIEYAVFGAIAGVSVSEVVASLYISIAYIVFQRKNRQIKTKISFTKSDTKEILKVAFPIAIVAIMLPLSSFADSFIIVNVLKWKGVDIDIATAEYGLLSGPVSSLINMPVVTIMSLAITIVPSVSSSRVKHDIDGILTKSELSIKIAYMIGIPFAILMMIFAYPIIRFLYPSLSPLQTETASVLLVICSSNVVLLSAMQIYISLLQALDMTKSVVLSLVCAISVKIGASVLLTKLIGINGSAIASIMMSAVCLTMLTITLKRLTSLRLENKVGRIIIAGSIVGLVGFAFSKVIVSDIVALIVSFVVCYIIYFYLILLLGIIDKREIQSLPFSKFISKVYKLVRFWEYDNG